MALPRCHFAHPYNAEGVRVCRVEATTNLEQSFAEAQPRALIQMATGAGKTLTACAYDIAAVGPALLHALAFESDGRVFRDLEEIRGTQILVPFVVLRCDAGGIDVDRAFELLKAAVHVAEEVPPLKLIEEWTGSSL